MRSFVLNIILCCLMPLSVFAKDISLDQLVLYRGMENRETPGIYILEGDDPVVMIKLNGERARDADWIELELRRMRSPNKVSLVFERSDKGYISVTKDYFFEKTAKDFEKLRFDLKQISDYQGRIKYVAMMFAGENEKIEIQKIQIGSYSLFSWISARVQEMFSFEDFSSSSINFINKPTWNGKRVSEVSGSFLLGLSVFSVVMFFLIRHHLSRRILIVVNVFFFIFFWIFLDLTHTMNQVKLCSKFCSAKNVMENARSYGAFTSFLEFIKKVIPSGRKGIFIAPYPFNVEGPYHIYPHLRLARGFDTDYVIVSNNYERHDYQFPVYDDEHKELKHKKGIFKVKKRIPYNDKMTIYEVQR